MAKLGMENLVFMTTTSFADTDTLLTLSAGHGARITKFPARAVMWNFSDHKSPEDALHNGTDDVEFMQLDSKSGDDLDVVQRGLEGIPAISSKFLKEYRIAVTATEAQWDKVCRAQPDGLGPFDAILAGTAGAVVEAVARFVRDISGEDCVHSIQGSDTEGDITEQLLGDTADPSNARLKLLKSAAKTDVLSVILNAVEFLTMEGRDRIGIRKAVPLQAGGIHIGGTIVRDKTAGRSVGTYVLATGVISGVDTDIVLVSAEGGPGTDTLDTITMATSKPVGNRVLLLIEPTTTGHDITVSEAGNIALQGGAYLIPDGGMIALLGDTTDNDTFTEVFRTRQSNYVHIRDEKSSGTGSGTFTQGAWRTRDLTTKVSDVDGLASLSTNQITLTAGTYRFRANAPGYICDDHRLRLQNVTDATTIETGVCHHVGSGSAVSSPAVVFGVFTIAASKALELQHRCNVTSFTIGFGVPASFGINEVYASIEFQRIV